MSLRARKTLVFVFMIILLLGLQGTNISWSKEKRAPKPKKKSVMNLSNSYEKPEITKEKVYRIELDNTTPEDYQFLKNLGLKCVQGEKIKCKADVKQLMELEKTGYEFSIIEKGIRVRKTHSDTTLDLNLYESVWDSNGTDVDIPDNDGWRYSGIEITEAPLCSEVTTIDVYFEIKHTFVGDLIVKLTNQDTPYTEYNLWNREGGGQEDIYKAVFDITDFAGQPVNQIWKLWAKDDSLLDVGYIDYWEIMIYYEVNAKVYGVVTYWNIDDVLYDYPLQEIKVSVEDCSTGLELGVTYTDTNGNYQIDFSSTGNPVLVKVDFFNIVIAGIYDWSNPDSLIKTRSSCMDPCGGFKEIYHLWENKAFRAAHIWDYIYKERKFVAENYNSWTRSGITCYVDSGETFVKSGYHSVDDYIRFTDAQYGWRIKTVLHEYAHAIHNEAYNRKVEWGGDYPDHQMNSVTDEHFAFSEGWAEFMSCIIPYEDPTRIIHDGGNIETNEWWKGPNGDNEYGSLVEGAVASALYDMQDFAWDSTDEWNMKDDTTATLYGMFADIFGIMLEHRPSTIRKFVQDWKDNIEDDYLSNSAVSIMRNHGIKVSYIADDEFIPTPQSFSLFQNYPNPFNLQTVINYDIPSEGKVNLTIYNILGQKVKTCVNQKMIPGYYKYRWDGKDDNDIKVASGVYIYRISYDNKHVSKLMLLLK